MPGIRVQVYPLPVTDNNGLTFVRSILGREAISTVVEPPPRAEGHRSSPGFPLTLVTLAAVAALALAANELFAVSLRWKTA
jgi:hypothetical protein